MAVRLEKAIGSTAGFWLRLQLNYDLAHIQSRARNIHARRLGATPAQLARPDNHARRPERRGVKFRSLTEAIDTETPTGRAMWQMIGVLAELERSLISERTRAGVKAAQRRGVKFGRKAKLSPRSRSPTPGS